MGRLKDTKVAVLAKLHALKHHYVLDTGDFPTRLKNRFPSEIRANHIGCIGFGELGGARRRDAFVLSNEIPDGVLNQLGYRNTLFFGMVNDEVLLFARYPYAHIVKAVFVFGPAWLSHVSLSG